jgi:hypothetical protein
MWRSILISLILSLASFAFAQEANLEISLPRDSLNILIKALDGTKISYQGKKREDLQAARVSVAETRILGMGDGKILVGLEGNIWIRYRPRPEENLGVPVGGSVEITPDVDFGAELVLIPEVDEAGKKLILRVNVSTLRLKRAEGLYELLIQMPGVEWLIRSEINRALQDMRIEIMDLSPYLVPQEVSLQQPRWKADHTLIIEPRDVKVEVSQDALKVRAFARVESRAAKD